MSAQMSEGPVAESATGSWLDDLRRLRAKAASEGARLLENIRRIRMSSERGPDPDYDRSVDEIADRVTSQIIKRYGMRHININNGDAPPQSNGEKRLLAWILGVLSMLLVGGTGGVIAMYGKLSSIEKGQEGHEQRINRLEAERDERYRARPGTP